jgi:hypothetical protein
MLILGGASSNNIKKERLEFLSNWATLAISDGAVVEFSDWSDLCGSTRKESFVRAIHLIARDPFLDRLNSKIMGHCHDSISGNAIKA